MMKATERDLKREKCQVYSGVWLVWRAKHDARLRLSLANTRICTVGMVLSLLLFLIYYGKDT